MKKVRILLSGNKSLEYYVDALRAVGAEPTAKYLPEVDIGYDGLILCGGNDIDPKYYGEEINGAVEIDKDRDTVEFALLDAYVKAGKPVLGICRGHQLINAYFGGSLHQHMPETPLHRTGNWDVTHPVTAAPGSVLAQLYGEKFCVNSYHHQVIKELGNGLQATAWWEGKYVEAIRHTTLPILSVQWHPERMCCSQAMEDTVDGLVFFKYFVELCKG